MNNESRELNVTLILILLLVFFFSYCAIPSHETAKVSHKPPKKNYKKVALNTHEETMDKQDEEKSAGSGENTVEVKTRPAEKMDEKLMAQAEDKSEVAPPSALPSAEADGKDVIAMNHPQYKKHQKSIVLFTHKKHTQDYVVECGSCHHDEKGTPLKLSQGDPVKGCIECHKGTEKSKAKDEKLSKEEKIAKYHFEAIHANCIGCHKDYNIEKGDPKGKGPAPVSCTKCHQK